VLERRTAVPRGVGQREPHLRAHDAVGADRRGGLDPELRVGDPAAGRHEVQLAGPDQLFGPQRIAVERRPDKQPRDRAQPDVGVRADLDGRWIRDVVRVHEIDEAPWPDRPPSLGGQHPEDPHPSDRSRAPLPHLDRAHAEIRRHRSELVDRPTHGSSLRLTPQQRTSMLRNRGRRQRRVAIR
jgi:hypothetical protein